MIVDPEFVKLTDHVVRIILYNIVFFSHGLFVNAAIKYQLDQYFTVYIL